MLYGQTIQSSKADLSSIKEEIRQLEGEITSFKQREKQTFELLEKYERQNYLINKLISNIIAGISSREQAIQGLQQQIIDLEASIAQLKDNYAKFLVAMYKGLLDDEFVYIIGAESISQAVARFKFLNDFSEKGKEDIAQIRQAQSQLEEKQRLIEIEKTEQQQLLADKKEEEASLKKLLKEKESVLNSIKQNKSTLQQQLQKKREAEQQISQMISRLIAEEEERRRRSNDSSTDNIETNRSDLDYSTDHLASFSALKGRLKWPVSGGTIIRKFGENKNRELNTVTLNYGIDIKISNSGNVRAVAEGRVSAIEWIPGYGSVLILSHKGGYRTVYGHLAEIHVAEGAIVKTSEILGKVGQSLEGYIIHFEIWDKRKHQNPVLWLRK